MRMQAKSPIAAVTVLALAAISLACVMSCWAPQPAMPPCHHHSSSSCAPLLLTAETPQTLVEAAPASASAIFVSAAALAKYGEAIAYARLDDTSPFRRAIVCPLFASAVLRI